MKKFDDAEIERIVKLLREGKPIPEDYKPILFDTKGGILEGHCKMDGILNKEDDLHGEVLCEKN